MAMVLSKVRYAPPMAGSEMRLKKEPRDVNMSVEVINPQAARAANALGWAVKESAPMGKPYTWHKQQPFCKNIATATERVMGAGKINGGLVAK